MRGEDCNNSPRPSNYLEYDDIMFGISKNIKGVKMVCQGDGSDYEDYRLSILRQDGA